MAAGGRVRAFCGIVETVPAGDPAEVDGTDKVNAEDCVTCVDVWLRRKWVRL